MFGLLDMSLLIFADNSYRAQNNEMYQRWEIKGYYRIERLLLILIEF